MAETSHTSQTYVEGDDTLLEAGEIANTESGNEADRKSESDIPYSREELVDRVTMTAFAASTTLQISRI